MNKKRLLLSMSAALVMSILLLFFTKLIPSWGEWYSYDPVMKMQTDSFASGNLALKESPFGHRLDWAWGNGLQQVWGLGVPLIKLPFELSARFFGYFGFPDRLIFLLFFFVTATFFLYALGMITSEDQQGSYLANCLITFYVFLNPALTNMINSKFGTYEEVIAYGYLWSLLLFAVMTIYLLSGNLYSYILVAFLAGLSPLIRPTIAAYGFIAFLLLVVHAHRIDLRRRWIAFPLFSFGFIVLLATNYVRFGSPFEFGHNLTLTFPIVNYFLKFDNPFGRLASVYDAAGELLSALFFLDLNSQFSLKKALLWQANLPRTREFHFIPYNFFTLVMLLLSWTSIPYLLMTKGRDYSKSIMGLFSAWTMWSFLSFSVLFVFYLRFPAVTSRYLVDFAPSIIVVIALFPLLASSVIRNDGKSNKAIILTFIPLIIIVGVNLRSLFMPDILDSKIYKKYDFLSMEEITNVTNYEIAEKNIANIKGASGGKLPEEYSCADRERTFGIPYNNEGWDRKNGCTVSVTSTHFFEGSSCVALKVMKSTTQSGDYSDEEIMVKVGTHFMQRSSFSEKETIKSITYCPVTSDHSESLNLISVKWFDLEKHAVSFLPPIRLLSIKKVLIP